MIGRVKKLRQLSPHALINLVPSAVCLAQIFPVDSLYSDYATLAAAHRQIVPETSHTAVFGGTAKTFYSF